MMRFILFCAVAAGCAAAGHAVSAGQERRARTLGEVMDAAQLLQVRMLDRLLSVSAALSMSECSLMRMMGERTACGASPTEVWEELSREESRRGGMLDCMTREDMDALTLLFDGLGESGRGEQERQFRAAIREIGRLEEEARKQKGSGARLYTALGLFFGMTLAVIAL